MNATVLGVYNLLKEELQGCKDFTIQCTQSSLSARITILWNGNMKANNLSYKRISAKIKDNLKATNFNKVRIGKKQLKVIQEDTSFYEECIIHKNSAVFAKLKMFTHKPNIVKECGYNCKNKLQCTVQFYNIHNYELNRMRESVYGKGNSKK